MKLILKRYINKFFGFFDSELVSKRELIQYRLQLHNSINILIDREKKKL